MGSNVGEVGEWSECEDIRVLGDDGQIIYTGPKWLRCAGPACGEIVTHGMFEKHDGRCGSCGWRRVTPATRLKPQEIEALRRGEYPLVEWEKRLIHDI